MKSDLGRTAVIGTPLQLLLAVIVAFSKSRVISAQNGELNKMVEKGSPRHRKQEVPDNARQGHAFMQPMRFPRFRQKADNRIRPPYNAQDIEKYAWEELVNSSIPVESDYVDIGIDAGEGIAKPYRYNVAYLTVKRCFDIIFSLCASILLFIPMVVIAVLIMIKDPGNPFFVQNRVGQNRKTLHMVKFRSMRKGADRLELMLTPEQFERYKKEYKLDDDPRLLGYKVPGDGSRCFGAMLRKTSLDELPQILFNICIKGDMSIVGPRPILQEELDDNYTPEQQELFLSAKPGLTGYWQAYARSDASYESGKRQEMELFYVRNMNTFGDIRIIFATLSAILKMRGAK